MKTEKQIKDSLAYVKNTTLPQLKLELENALDREDYNDAIEACFSLTSNIAAIQAAERVLD